MKWFKLEKFGQYMKRSHVKTRSLNLTCNTTQHPIDMHNAHFLEP